MARYEAACSRPCFCVKQKFQYSANYNEGTLKFSSQNLRYRTVSLKKVTKFVCQSKHFGGHHLVLSTCRAFEFTYVVFRWCRNWSAAFGFAQQLRQRNADIPNIYFGSHVIDAAR